MRPLTTAALLLLLALPAHGTPTGTDSTLYARYTLCQQHVRDSTALRHADTLLEMAATLGSVRMQAAALAFKADHYYVSNRLDSMRVWVERVVEYARRHGELDYIYFARGRLITAYSKDGQYNMALVEINRMLEEAEQDNYPQGVATGYEQMGHIYQLTGSPSVAVESYRNALKVPGADTDFSRSTLYSNLAVSLEAAGEYEEALEALHAADTTVRIETQRWTVLMRYVPVYLHLGQPAQARKALEEVQRVYRAGQLPPMQYPSLLTAEREYYYLTGQYRRARASNRRLLEELRTSGINEKYYLDDLWSDILIDLRLGDSVRAASKIVPYRNALHARNEEALATSLSEFSTLLDVEQLNRENASLEAGLQSERLHRIRLLVITLSIILLVGVLSILMLVRLTRRLRRSREDLLRKNRALEASEQQLLVAKERAEKASGMKSLFIRNITHEIRTPMNAIVGFTQLIADRTPDDEEMLSHQQIIQTNADYLLQLIDTVLHISDLESCDRLPTTETDIGTCCQQVLDEMRRLAGSELTLRFVPCPACPPLRTSPVYLSCLLTCLMHNAVKFTKKGWVELACRMEEGSLCIRVTDTGPGIPPEDAERIFERFYKADSFVQGLGLGLTLSRMIAEKLGGTVRLDTAYRDGARFLFTLPLSEP